MNLCRVIHSPLKKGSDERTGSSEQVEVIQYVQEVLRRVPKGISILLPTTQSLQIVYIFEVVVTHIVN